jgi:hypothetical protein
VYDEVDFSDTWVVHRYHVPDAAPGNYVFGNHLPYPPAPVTVAQFNVKRFGPPTGPTREPTGQWHPLAA